MQQIPTEVGRPEIKSGISTGRLTSVRILAKELGHTCEKGVCLEGTEENSEGKSIKTFCTFKPLIKDVTFDTKLNESTCTYYFQKYFGLISNFSVWNYSGFFQLMKNKSVFTL